MVPDLGSHDSLLNFIELLNALFFHAIRYTLCI